jgi:8-oxo-dGTP pyrophosphatase MutT (NUDIX family)
VPDLTEPLEGFRRAAVLVPLYDSDGATTLLLTRRTQTVEHHKGQISFPGGALDDGEELLAAALRETFEEVGIPADEVQILGRLPEVDVTVSRFRVTPFVGVIPHPYPLRLNADEIEEIVRVPLAVFRDPANLRIDKVEWAGQIRDVYHYTYQTRTIWGATARIIRHFVDLVLEMEAPPSPLTAGGLGGGFGGVGPVARMTDEILKEARRHPGETPMKETR